MNKDEMTSLVLVFKMAVSAGPGTRVEREGPMIGDMKTDEGIKQVAAYVELVLHP